MFERLQKKIVGLLPGTALNIAQQKRSVERRLRAEGFSRSAATAEVARRFKSND